MLTIGRWSEKLYEGNGNRLVSLIWWGMVNGRSEDREGRLCVG